MKPLQVAFNPERFADRALAGVSTLRRDKELSKELEQTLTDIESMSHLGNYFADKIRWAVELAYFRITNDSVRQQEAVQLLEAAINHWKSYTSTATNQYKPQLFSRTRLLDWWQILEDVEQDVIIAKENIQPWPDTSRYWSYSIGSLLRALKTEFQPKWKNINVNLTINEIEEFASSIEKLGMKY